MTINKIDDLMARQAKMIHDLRDLDRLSNEFMGFDDYKLLYYLSETKLESNGLAHKAAMSVQNISRRIKRLEKQGYITKQFGFDPKDQRKVQLNITPEGEKVLTEATRQYSAWYDENIMNDKALY